VTFVEQSPRALAALRRNLAAAAQAAGRFPEAPGDAAGTLVLAGDGTRFLPPPGACFDIVLADPPYALFDPLPESVCRAPALAPGARVLLECAAARIAPVRLHGLRLIHQRAHGASSFALYELAPGDGIA
jgi:16S rRNA G966 N2-methylase RsmD